MQLKNLVSFKPWVILGIFILAWYILPAFVKSFTNVGFFHLQAPVWNINSKIKDLTNYWALKNHSKQSLLEAARDLARLNASYELRLRENDALKEEVKKLEELLHLPKAEGYEYIWARVIRRDINSWWHQAVIHKGKKQGVNEGAAVIYGQGVVGRIKKAYNNYSTIELVSSPTFRIAARFEGDRRPVTFKGAPSIPFCDPIGIVSNVPTDSRTHNQAPLRLVSSQLGGVFPDGLTIGYVSELQPGSDGLFMKANVLLDSQLHIIEEVAILMPLTQHTFNED